MPDKPEEEKKEPLPKIRKGDVIYFRGHGTVILGNVMRETGPGEFQVYSDDWDEVFVVALEDIIELAYRDEG